MTLMPEFMTSALKAEPRGPYTHDTVVPAALLRTYGQRRHDEGRFDAILAVDRRADANR